MHKILSRFVYIPPLNQKISLDAVLGLKSILGAAFVTEKVVERMSSKVEISLTFGEFEILAIFFWFLIYFLFLLGLVSRYVLFSYC